jgi:hypothetical protein
VFSVGFLRGSRFGFHSNSKSQNTESTDNKDNTENKENTATTLIKNPRSVCSVFSVDFLGVLCVSRLRLRICVTDPCTK